MSKNDLYKHPVYGYVAAESISTPVGRLAWPFLKDKKPPMEPKPGQKPMPARYEATIIIERNETGKKFEAELRVLAKEMVKLYNKDRNTTVNEPSGVLKDGDEPKLKEYPYYHGKWFLVARNEEEIPILSSDGVSHVPADFLKGGMLARAQVRPTFTSWGLSFKLEAIQYAGDDGQRFAGGQRSQESLLQALTDVAPPEGVELESPPSSEPVKEVTPVTAPKPLDSTQQEMELKAKGVKMTEETPAPAQEAPKGFAAVRAAQASKIKGKTAAINLL